MCEVLWPSRAQGSLWADASHVAQWCFQQASHHQFDGALTRFQSIKRRAGDEREPPDRDDWCSKAGELRGEEPLEHGAIHGPK
jgi:hypothetical protein